MEGYKCEKCNKQFKYQKPYLKHIRVAHGQDITIDKPEKSYECDECTKTFTSQIGYTGHINAVHLGKRHKCEYCQQEF